MLDIMSYCNKLVNARVTWFNIGFVRRNKLVVYKMFRHSVTNKSYEYFAKHWRACFFINFVSDGKFDNSMGVRKRAN